MKIERLLWIGLFLLSAVCVWPDISSRASELTNEPGQFDLEKAKAEKGDSTAQYNLGFSYRKAAESYRKAAEQGDPEAQFSLGLCYENGNGVHKDLSEAMNWYKKAAAQGDTDAKAAIQTNRRGFGYYFTQTIMIASFLPAFVILTAVALSALRNRFGNKTRNS